MIGMNSFYGIQGNCASPYMFGMQNMGQCVNMSMNAYSSGTVSQNSYCLNPAQMCELTNSQSLYNNVYQQYMYGQSCGTDTCSGTSSSMSYQDILAQVNAYLTANGEATIPAYTATQAATTCSETSSSMSYQDILAQVNAYLTANGEDAIPTYEECCANNPYSSISFPSYSYDYGSYCYGYDTAAAEGTQAAEESDDSLSSTIIASTPQSSDGSETYSFATLSDDGNSVYVSNKGNYQVISSSGEVVFSGNSDDLKNIVRNPDAYKNEAALLGVNGDNLGRWNTYVDSIVGTDDESVESTQADTTETAGSSSNSSSSSSSSSKSFTQNLKDSASSVISSAKSAISSVASSVKKSSSSAKSAVKSAASSVKSASSSAKSAVSSAASSVKSASSSAKSAVKSAASSVKSAASSAKSAVKSAASKIKSAFSKK